MTVQASEERPASVWVQITGGMSDPVTCDAKLLLAQQERKGNVVRITVRAREPMARVCHAILVGFEITVLLDGRFTPGVYRVIVNSKGNSLEKEFEVTW